MQKSGEKDESSRSGTLTFNMTLHASERGAAARKSQRVTRKLLESKSLSDLVSQPRATHHRHRARPVDALAAHDAVAVALVRSSPASLLPPPAPPPSGPLAHAPIAPIVGLEPCCIAVLKTS